MSDLNLIKEKFGHYYDDMALELICRSFVIAKEALKEEFRSNGEPFIEHPLAVAQIIATEIALPAECVAAVFLHEATRKNKDLNSKEIKDGKFGEDIITMVYGLNKISTIKPKDTKLEAENYKKLIVQYSKDPRVTVIKIADRLEVMRKLSIFPKLSRENKILETLMLYIPLAHQLGLYNIKSEMEDIYFRFAQPQEYRAITNKLKASEKDRIKISEEFLTPLEKDLKEAGIDYKMKVRTKAAYSIFKKMEKQKVPFEKVYDVFAIRFIIACKEDRKTEHDLCWKVYSYVTKEYDVDTNRLRDWLTNPKDNGYESLHVTVKNKDNSYLEVQIRTKRMDDEAENGQAAHWSYKGIRHEENMDRWLSSVRYALEHPSSVAPEDLPHPPSKDIFVFTPSGELRILPQGASVLDFAFNIHSGLGTKCIGGKINGKAVSIKEKLSTGDVVEVMSGKNQKPSPDWLNCVVTSKAKSKIKLSISEAEFKKAFDGKELLSRRLKNWKLELKDEYLGEFIKKYHYGTVNSFYAALGEGTLDINTIKSYILEREAASTTNGNNSTNTLKTNKELKSIDSSNNTNKIGERDWQKRDNASKSIDDILVLNAHELKGLDYKMAKCCHPVFGDDVFGFVTRTEGIKIHRISCPNASRLIENYPYRIQKVKWSDNPSKSNFQVSLRISATIDTAVINQIMDIVNNFKASIRSFNAVENNRNGCYDILLTLAVPSNMELDKVISQIKLQKNIIKVNRA